MTDFWQVHGVWFLVGMVLVPRLTMLCFAATPFGALAWIAWFLWPSGLAAFFATVYYLDTNPLLVCGAWAWAFIKAYAYLE